MNARIEKNGKGYGASLTVIDRLANVVVEHTVLAWVVLLAVVAAGGWLVGELSGIRAERERLANLQLDAERSSIELMSQTLNGNQMGAIGLLGLIDDNAKKEARNEREPNSKDAAALMESIARAYDADGAYIVGEDGIIKSSWGVGRPLTGVDVKFRPYTQMAFKGQQNVYAAIGTTTGRRNLYYAVPLYAGKSHDTPVIGAVVLRSGVVQLDRLIVEAGAIALLLSPQGLVFSASREEWIGRAAGHLAPDRIKEIRQLRQFGTLFDDRDPELLPFAVAPGIGEVDGVRHAVVQARVKWNDPYGDWTLLVMEDLTRTVSWVDRLRIGLVAGAVMLFIGWLVNLLLLGHHRQVVASRHLADYARAQKASAERKAQQAATALRLQQARTPAALVEAFLGEAHRTLGAMQGVVYVRDSASSDTLHLAGSYACAGEVPVTLTMGEGLLGQCAVERRAQLVETGPAGFGIIHSGLGGTRPAALLMAPILLNETLLGVAEVALLRVPGEDERQQFEEMSGFLAMNLEILGRSVQAQSNDGGRP